MSGCFWPLKVKDQESVRRNNYTRLFVDDCRLFYQPLESHFLLVNVSFLVSTQMEDCQRDLLGVGSSPTKKREHFE